MGMIIGCMASDCGVLVVTMLCTNHVFCGSGRHCGSGIDHTSVTMCMDRSVIWVLDIFIVTVPRTISYSITAVMIRREHNGLIGNSLHSRIAITTSFSRSQLGTGKVEKLQSL